MSYLNIPTYNNKSIFIVVLYKEIQPPCVLAIITQRLEHRLNPILLILRLNTLVATDEQRGSVGDLD
jgi:hypothetical protein